MYALSHHKEKLRQRSRLIIKVATAKSRLLFNKAWQYAHAKHVVSAKDDARINAATSKRHALHLTWRLELHKAPATERYV
jgi:hypothetical protein